MCLQLLRGDFQRRLQPLRLHLLRPLLRLLQGDSSNVSEEDLFYQLPAQVGSSAPILGEVHRPRKQSSPITTSSTSAEETLATSPTEDLQQGSAAASTVYEASSTQAIKETLGNVSIRVVEPVELALLHD